MPGEENGRKEIGLDFVSKITAYLFAGRKDWGGIGNVSGDCEGPSEGTGYPGGVGGRRHGGCPGLGV